MTIEIQLANLVTITVDGTTTGADGKAKDFSFDLTCDRLDADALAALNDPANEQSKRPLVDVIVDLSKNWNGPVDAQGAPVPFGADQLRQLLRIPGLPLLVWHRYLADVGAKAKN